MRHDLEKATCETVAAYITATLDSAIASAAPIVSFYDPMNQFDSSRVVVSCGQGTSKLSGEGSAVMQVEVGVRTIVSQPTASADIATHFDRVNAVRDLFNTSTPDDDVAAYNVSGIAVDRIESQRGFTTETDTAGGFMYSALTMQIHVHTTTEA